MSRRLAGLCTLIALLGSATQADAGQSRQITLRLGDTFVVSGTDLGCEAQIGTKVMKGHRLIACFKINRGALAAQSYVAALGDDGRVVVGSVKTNGSIGAAVFNRKPAALGTSAKQIIVHTGDKLLLAGTNLACGVNNDLAGIYPTCFRVTPKGGLPGSYAFAETETFVAVVRFDATGKTTKVIFKRTQA
jgi:hypothetical protein